MSESLSLGDRLFVKLLTSGRARSVVHALEVRPERWDEVFTGGLGSISRRAELSQWYALLRSAVRALAKGAKHCNQPDVVVCEMAPSSKEARSAYFGLFLPEVEVGYVSPRNDFCAGLPIFRTLLLLAGLAGLALFDRGPVRSQLRSRRVAIARFCLVSLSHALASKRREAYLMRLYQPHIPILAAFLMNHGVTVNIVTNPGPMLPAEFAIPADKLVLTHPAQVGTALRWSGRRMAKSLTLWGPFDLPQMREMTGEVGVTADESVEIGVYTQGYWLRLREGSIAAETGERYAALEHQLMAVVEAYLDSHPGARAIHFPHPMERRHYAATAEMAPWSVLRDSRVESRYDDALNSVGSFGRVAVGVTTLSTVAYDRLYAGHPALFYLGDAVAESFEEDLSIRDLISRTPDELTAAIDLVLGMERERFFVQYFGGPLDQWQPDAETQAMMRDYARASR